MQPKTGHAAFPPESETKEASVLRKCRCGCTVACLVIVFRYLAVACRTESSPTLVAPQLQPHLPGHHLAVQMPSCHPCLHRLRLKPKLIFTPLSKVPSSPPTQPSSLRKSDCPLSELFLADCVLLRTADGMSSPPANSSSSASFPPSKEYAAILVASGAKTHRPPGQWQPSVVNMSQRVDRCYYVIMTWGSILHIITIRQEPITATTHINVTKPFLFIMEAGSDIVAYGNPPEPKPRHYYQISGRILSEAKKRKNQLRSK